MMLLRLTVVVIEPVTSVTRWLTLSVIFCDTVLIPSSMPTFGIMARLSVLGNLMSGLVMDLGRGPSIRVSEPLLDFRFTSPTSCTSFGGSSRSLNLKPSAPKAMVTSPLSESNTVAPGQSSVAETFSAMLGGNTILKSFMFEESFQTWVCFGTMGESVGGSGVFSSDVVTFDFVLTRNSLRSHHSRDTPSAVIAKPLKVMEAGFSPSGGMATKSLYLSVMADVTTVKKFRGMCSISPVELVLPFTLKSARWSGAPQPPFKFK
mmetsp:Transcript_56083/g.119401  ORF Transcript_56083/g.119401 Transcript_56083/m.119401 type:complete len:262 (+) Transcript_56083:832-1617(+)